MYTCDLTTKQRDDSETYFGCRAFLACEWLSTHDAAANDESTVAGIDMFPHTADKKKQKKIQKTFILLGSFIVRVLPPVKF